MNKVGWIIFAAVVIGLLGGLIIWTRITNPPIDVSNIDVNKVIAASSSNGEIADHVFGIKDSKVVLVEYGDFQCPSCKGAYPGVKEIVEEYGDRVTIIFRNFPLATIHPNARAAAGAAEAAGLQGKYREMHDKLFESQDAWKALDANQRTDIFKGYAEELGLDVAKFTEDLASDAVNRKISFDQTLGKNVNVTGTPTFFLNGEKLEGEEASTLVNGDATKMKELLDRKLAE